MVAALFAVGLLTAGCPPKAADSFKALENRIGGHIGIAAFDSNTGRRIDYRADDRFPMCSTFKLLAAAAVLKRVDQGKEKLDRFVTYTKADLLEYAPVTRRHVGEGGMTLGTLCEAAIEQSDNTAGNLLLRVIGGPGGLTNFARSIGDKVTRLDRTEPALNNFSPGDQRDTTSPRAMQQDLVKLLTTDVLSVRSRSQLEAWLVGNQTGSAMIRAAVPAGFKVGDKTGRSGDGTMNDVAIIRPPSRRPIFIAVYSRGTIASVDKRASVVADAARTVFHCLDLAAHTQR
jgi:beta-lactamase class A